ncbi:HlyD family efflux transporter periplasmic adaptor subunit [Euhalothece natronophila Z-M001]|uniref:HlyD family efflux transporter periplasmic adaptor subunit n=1 Tax=Euhalothece natronophila Z-M001 TaxID=522448 RepID=A0A5B8NKN1_9CHRO|nr:HlyD family efflux transporter periplasmic adaptor subunit [Euhalothece natronophila]QDZ38669.1 HlyD family efflux transporter periplasmic adaptor subunit [Euhalothece natronophila Z-M001]
MSQSNNKNPQLGSNGNGNGKISLKSAKIAQSETTTPTTYDPYEEDFDQSVILRQSPVWPRIALWTILLVITGGLAWSYFAKIEQVVEAQGQLKPTGDVKEVQSPVQGVVREIATNETIQDGENPNRQGETFEDGDLVEEGQILLHYDSETAESRLNSLENIRDELQQENSFYRQIMETATTSESAVEAEIDRLDIPTEIAMLARNRTALEDENRLYRAQAGIAEPDDNLSVDELERLEASTQEASTRREAAFFEGQGLQRELRQVQVQLADAQTQLSTEEEKLEKLRTLFEEGGISEFRYIEQRQTVEQQQAQVEQLKEEEQRVESNISRADQQLQNTEATTRKDLFDNIARNKQQIAEIDSQLTRSLNENQRRISELESEINEVEKQLDYQNLRAPISGKIFNMEVSPGSVVNSSERVMKIVPQEDLVAEVFITNQDIGFVQEGMPVDVRIDSFPFSEYGDIEGELISLGSDALPPDETHDFYRFPAKIRLDSQTLDARGRDLPLQSGMSISTNIKLREDRRVISLFLERFTQEVDNLKNVR